MRWWLQLQNQHGNIPLLVYCLWSLIPLLCSCLLSCRACGLSVKLSNISLKLPQIAFHRKANDFILQSEYNIDLGGIVKGIQGTFTLVSLSLAAPHMTVDKKSKMAKMISQSLGHAKTQLSLRKRSSSVFGKPSLGSRVPDFWGVTYSFSQPERLIWSYSSFSVNNF